MKQTTNRLLVDTTVLSGVTGKRSKWVSVYCSLLHVTRKFYSMKLICRNLYALFSHVKKAYTANQICVQLFHMWKFSQ